MKYLNVFIMLIIGVFHYSCDLEKMSSYDYDTDLMTESVKIYGTITNRYTFEPVKDVVVSMQNQSTFTGADGKYLLYYHFTQDEDRNQPVALKIEEPNYNTIDTSIIVFPENEINVFLKYAAPEIKKICLIDTLGICQAIVHDYQGYNDIVFVEVNLAYRIPGNKYPSLYTRTRLTRVKTDSIQTSYYQVQAPLSLDEFGNLMNLYDAYTEDKNKHSDAMLSTESGASDSLLFPFVTK